MDNLPYTCYLQQNNTKVKLHKKKLRECKSGTCGDFHNFRKD